MGTRISVYANCSMGGMATVLRNRAISSPGTRHLIYFARDAGGLKSFSDIANVDVRITQKARLTSYVCHMARLTNADEISITSMPEVAVAIAATELKDRLVYEVHTSTAEVIRNEFEILSGVSGLRIRVPSRYTQDQVESLIPAEIGCEYEIAPNLVDTRVFTPSGDASRFDQETVPLLWVGRLDKGKNPNDFLRLLTVLPLEYRGLLVMSLENGPERLADLLGLASQYGVADRLEFRSDISQFEMANLFRGVRDAGGSLISTSLAESFGYSVVEATSCGTQVSAYEVGAIAEHSDEKIELVPAGSVRGLAASVLRRVRSPIGVVG